MKSTLFSAALAIAFLSAGAFAGDNAKNPPAQIMKTNVTVVTKNQAWPIKGRIASDSCQVVRCVDI